MANIYVQKDLTPLNETKLKKGDCLIFKLICYELDELWLISFCNDLKLVHGYNEYVYEFILEGNFFGRNGLILFLELDIEVKYLDLSFCLDRDSFSVFNVINEINMTLCHLSLREIGLGSVDILSFFQCEGYKKIKKLKSLDFSYNELEALDLVKIIKIITTDCDVDVLGFNGCMLDLDEFARLLMGCQFFCEKEIRIFIAENENETEEIKDELNKLGLRSGIVFIWDWLMLVKCMSE